MRRSLISGIAIAAFVAVEFMSVQTSDAQRAQRFRRILQRNNNCVNGCCDCGTTSSIGSDVIVSESPVAISDGTIIESGGIESAPFASDGAYISEGIVSDGFASEPIVQAAPIGPTVFESSLPQGEIVSASIAENSGGFASPEMGPHTFAGLAECQNGCNAMETPAMNPEFAVDTGISSMPVDSGVGSIGSVPAAIGTGGVPVEEAIKRNRMAIESMTAGGPSGPMGTMDQSYPIDSGINVIPASAPITESPIMDAGYVDGGYAEGGIIQTGMTDGNFISEGSVIGDVMGCATGDCGGQIIQGEIQGEIQGDFMIGNPGEQIISSGDTLSGEMIYDAGPQEFSQGSPVEQVISSEIISETPMGASNEVTTSEDSVTTEPPSEAPTSDAPAAESPAKKDKVPEAPPKVRADDKEA